MLTDTLTIVVNGNPGTGTTTLTQFLAKALKRAGFNLEVDYLYGWSGDKFHYKKRVQSVKTLRKIILKERNTKWD